MPKKQQTKAQKRERELHKARAWLAAYDGGKQNIARNYRKKFGVDMLCAIRDLQEIGVTFSEEYISAVRDSEERRIEQKARKKEERMERNNNRHPKNHQWVDGKLLQTNKKWSHLKESQKQWIFEVTEACWHSYVDEHGDLPMKKRKEVVLDAVHEQIDQRDIWIPYHEFKAAVSKKIDRLNHKSPLFHPPQKKSPPKPKTPQVSFDDFPLEEKECLLCTLDSDIRRYIRQTHKVPPNRVRDADINRLLKVFNAKKCSQYGKKMISSPYLLEQYDMMRQNAFQQLFDERVIPQPLSSRRKEQLKKASHILETERLLLRKLTTKNWKELHPMLSDPEVMYAWERTFSSKREIQDWIIRQLRRYEKEQVGYFAAVDKASGENVGQIGLMWNEIQGCRCLEVGYIIAQEHWKRGFAAEGAAACLDYGFALYDVHKIYATIRPENTSSIRVAERLGMALEGSYIKKYDGKHMEHLIFSNRNPAHTSAHL
ncbi:GNAT family N-acetyltransferase [Ruminococcaceae bacterium OttesenSCG-928-L11]|nr:GNAT family N-acetyltransferase [Ruminococcaceae bacterium OttesenSCG-928-L11]